MKKTTAQNNDATSAATQKTSAKNEVFEASETSTGSASLRNTTDTPALRLQVDLFKLGRDRAVDSGALKPRETDLIALRDNAEAMARETRRDVYDPKRK